MNQPINQSINQSISINQSRFERRGRPLLSMPLLQWFLCKAGPERFLYFRHLLLNLHMRLNERFTHERERCLPYLFLHKVCHQESHFFISGWRFTFGIRILLLSSPSPPPSPSSNLPPPSSPLPPPRSNLFFGVLGGIVLLFHPLLVPGLVSSERPPPIDAVGRSLEVGGIFAFFLNLKLSDRTCRFLVVNLYLLSSSCQVVLAPSLPSAAFIQTGWWQVQNLSWGVNTPTANCASTLCG